jgi:hypothetical protein
MQRTGINKIGKAQLPDAAQTLEIRMFNNIENQARRNGDKPVNWIVKDFFLLKTLLWNVLENRNGTGSGLKSVLLFQPPPNPSFERRGA